MDREKKATTRKTTSKKGEEGYWERETEAAHAAAAKEHAVFETVEDFQQAAEKYFAAADEKNELYGEAGLCLGLSKFNRKGRNVSLTTLRKWYDGDACAYLQEAVQMAYLRIQAQIESDPRYGGKSGMTTRAIFLQRQTRLGGYQDKQESRNDVNLNVTFGKNMDKSDFE